MAKYVKKVRINITMDPRILKDIKAVVGDYNRSRFIADACKEKLAKDKA